MPAITQACRDAGMTWNDSVLNPIVTIQIFFLQILHGNTAAAYCKARIRVKLEVLCTLLERSVGQLQQETFKTGRWLGHRVFHIDGSSFSMPDTPELQAHFGQPGEQTALDECRTICNAARFDQGS